MRQTWKDLWQERHDAYESDYKIIVDRSPFRSGKSLTPMLYFLENNTNNMAFIDTHKIKMELYKKIYQNQFENFLVYVLFGTEHLLTQEEQIIFNYSRSLCPARLNNMDISILFQKDFMSYNYCQDICTYRYECPHKNHIKEAFNVKNRPDLNNLIMMTKAHLHTDLPNRLTNQLDKEVGILDENLSSYLYKQIDVYPNSIHEFGKFITFIYMKYNILKDFRNLVIDWLTFLYDILVVDIEKRTNRKIKDISDKLDEILESWEIKDIINDNEKFKELAGNHINKVRKIYNQVPSLIKILEDIEKNKELKKNIVIDKSEYIFSYYINKLDNIKELISSFYKTIITDRNFMPDLIETIFPEYSDNYLIIGDKEEGNKHYFKNVYIYQMKYAGKNYGTYPKPSLYKPYYKFQKSFFTLVNISNQAIEHEAQMGNTSGLLISHKPFIKEIKKLNSPLVKKFGVDMKYNYYFNIKGLMYPDRNYGITLGSCNTPLRFRKIMNQMYNFDLKWLEWLYGPGEYLQCAGRLQDPDRNINNLPNFYVLTNAYIGYFDNEINFEGFSEIKYKNILNYLAKNGWTLLKEIMLLTKKSDKPTKDILVKLEKEGLIKWKKGETTSKGGAKPDLWNIK